MAEELRLSTSPNSNYFNSLLMTTSIMGLPLLTNAHFVNVLINRSNVYLDVRLMVSSCKQFFLMEGECSVIAAAMEELHVQDIDDIPVDDIMPSNLTTKKRKRFLGEVSSLSS